jgi:hypothetical protein
LDKLPPIQSTINTGSLATTGSNTFTGTQTISGSRDTLFTIGASNSFGGNSFDLRTTGSEGTIINVTSNALSQFGAIADINDYSGNASLFSNSVITGPVSDGPTAGILIQKSGSLQSTWLFDYDGKSAFPGDINIGYEQFGTGLIYSGSLNVTKGNVNVSGSVYVSSSLVVASSVVNNGTIDALNSDLIIEGGYLILTGSVVPVGPTGSAGDKEGMVVFDDNFLYYCTKDYEEPTTGSIATFTISDGGTSHIYNLGTPGNNWNAYHTVGADPFLQTGPSQTGGGADAPSAGWYFVDDNGIVRQLLNSPVWFSGGAPSPYPNGTGWMCVVDSYDWVYSDSNTTLTFYESIPTVTPLSSATPPTLCGGLWKQTKLGETPNYAPFGSGSWDVQAIGEVTELDITKDIHLLDTTGNNGLYHWYLPDGLYDGQVVRFTLKGDNDTNPSYVKIWMNNIRTYNGTIVSSTTWHPFYCGEGQGPCRSLGTAVFIDGAWNIDTDWWDM